MSEVDPLRRADALGPQSLYSGASIDRLGWCAVWEANLFSSIAVCDTLLCVNTFASKSSWMWTK